MRYATSLQVLNLRQLLTYIMQTYPDTRADRRSIPFTGSPVARQLRSGLHSALLESSFRLPPPYLAEGGAGQATWAEVPWLAILDRSVTTSVEHGYYVVYLFKANMEGVYLSLNQGWTQYQRQFARTARDHINSVAGRLRQLLPWMPVGFSEEPIDLASERSLARGYELGHVCGRYYPLQDLPADDVLVEDLRQALDLYRILKSRVGTDLLHYEFAETALDDPTEDDQRRVDSEVSSTSSPEDIEQRRQELEERARQTGDPHKRSRLVRAIEPNPVFARFTKEAAGYVCTVCGAPGFAKVRGGKYAEAHHKEHLALGGADAPSNMICVCPTCHAMLHYGSDQALLERALPAFASQVLSWR